MLLKIVWGPGPPWLPVPMPLDTFIVMSSLAAPAPSHRVRAGAARLSDEQVDGGQDSIATDS